MLTECRCVSWCIYTVRTSLFSLIGSWGIGRYQLVDLVSYIRTSVRLFVTVTGVGGDPTRGLKACTASRLHQVTNRSSQVTVVNGLRSGANRDFSVRTATMGADEHSYLEHKSDGGVPRYASPKVHAYPRVFSIPSGGSEDYDFKMASIRTHNTVLGGSVLEEEIGDVTEPCMKSEEGEPRAHVSNPVLRCSEVSIRNDVEDFGHAHAEPKQGEEVSILLRSEGDGVADGGGEGGAEGDTGRRLFAPATGMLPRSESELQQARILVVDDAPLNRKMLARLLLKKCASVEEAEDGAQCIAMVEESERSGCPYQAVLMDYQMPVMDGPTATSKLRSMGFLGLVIGVTGNAMKADVETFLRHGANRVLPKPLDMELLEKTVLGTLCRCRVLLSFR